MREKRQIERPSHIREEEIFVIAVEGRHTERRYFEGIGAYHNNPQIIVKVLPTKDGRNSPKAVMSRLEGASIEEGDSFWVVVDRDCQTRTEEQLDEVAQACVEKGYAFIVSNPCFELWLLLHWRDPEGQSAEELARWYQNEKMSNTKRYMDVLLYQDAGSYHKRIPYLHDYFPFAPIAIERAKALDVEPDKAWPKSLCTKVYQLMEALLSRVEI